jgi:ankyrin repeat protein
LVENGADVNYSISPIKMTALHWAAFSGDIATCRYLCENGASFPFSTQDYSPVDIAGICGYAGVVKYFAEFLA